MRIMITGAAGFIGSAVALAAAKAGHEVFAMVRAIGNAHRLKHETHLKLIEVDLREFTRVDVVLEEYRPEIIIHSAWGGVSNQTRLDERQIADNVASSCHLIYAGARNGLEKFIGIGSQAEYGNLNAKVNEAQISEPTTLYGAAKLAVQILTKQLALQKSVSFAWIRIFSCYGPGDNPNWLIPSLINQMLDGALPKTTLGEQRGDYLFIDDLARGILSVALSSSEGVFNLGSGRTIPIRTIVEKIRDLTSPKLELKFGEIPYGANQVWHMEADIRRIEENAHWSPEIDFDTGLETTVRWHRSLRNQLNES